MGLETIITMSIHGRVDTAIINNMESDALVWLVQTFKVSGDVIQSLASPIPSAFIANIASASGRQGES